jgi:hypothetical protein
MARVERVERVGLEVRAARRQHDNQRLVFHDPA